MEEVRRPLEMKLPESIRRLETAFTGAGYQLYVVGGAVRDAVLGLEPKDFDLATNATPQQVQELIDKEFEGWKTDLTGQAFGVVRALDPERWRAAMNEVMELTAHFYEHEIATFREDMSAGRHPEVRFATIKEDVQRRDLTINALFYDINRQEVVDLVGGLEDLDEGVVRMVGQPEDRLAEDRLRILRAIRFAVKFDFELDEFTSMALLADNSLEGISPERVRDEFVRSIASAKDIRKLLTLYNFYNLWPQVFPGLNVNAFGVNERRFTHLMALLLDGNDPDIVSKRLNELRYSENEYRPVSFLLRFRDMKPIDSFRMRKQFQISKLTPGDLIGYAFLRGAPDMAIVLAFGAYVLGEPVKGDDLLAEGYSGRGLGVEMERRELELFTKLYKKVLACQSTT